MNVLFGKWVLPTIAPVKSPRPERRVLSQLASDRFGGYTIDQETDLAPSKPVKLWGDPRWFILQKQFIQQFSQWIQPEQIYTPVLFQNQALNQALKTVFESAGPRLVQGKVTASLLTYFQMMLQQIPEQADRLEWRQRIHQVVLSNGEIVKPHCHRFVFERVPENPHLLKFTHADHEKIEWPQEDSLEPLVGQHRQTYLVDLQTGDYLRQGTSKVNDHDYHLSVENIPTLISLAIPDFLEGFYKPPTTDFPTIQVRAKGTLVRDQRVKEDGFTPGQIKVWLYFSDLFLKNINFSAIEADTLKQNLNKATQQLKISATLAEKRN